MYLRAFERMIARHKVAGRKCSWDTAEQAFKWWTDMNYDPAQITIEDWEREL
jgi:hypothetical protein